MDFNTFLMTLQSREGFQNGITWTTSDFGKRRD
jgi:HJR/Mrr/RecB family endonuclease